MKWTLATMMLLCSYVSFSQAESDPCVSKGCRGPPPSSYCENVLEYELEGGVCPGICRTCIDDLLRSVNCPGSVPCPRLPDGCENVTEFRPDGPECSPTCLQCEDVHRETDVIPSSLERLAAVCPRHPVEFTSPCQQHVGMCNYHNDCTKGMLCCPHPNNGGCKECVHPERPMFDEPATTSPAVVSKQTTGPKIWRRSRKNSRQGSKNTYKLH